MTTDIEDVCMTLLIFLLMIKETVLEELSVLKLIIRILYFSAQKFYFYLFTVHTFQIFLKPKVYS